MSMISKPLVFPLALVLCAFLLLPAAMQAQDLHPSRRLSPLGIAKTHIGETYAKVTYGRPYVRNRAIFGQPNDSTTYLVPFDQLWRTGANEATEITLTGPLTVAGQPLDAGTYAIFTEPRANEWVIHFSPQLGLDGTGRLGPDGSFTPDVYDPAQDVLTVTVPSQTMEETVDPFTMSWEPVAEGAHLVLRWEQTEVRIPFE